MAGLVTENQDFIFLNTLIIEYSQDLFAQKSIVLIVVKIRT